MAPSAISNSPEGMRPISIGEEKVLSSLKMNGISLTSNGHQSKIPSSSSNYDLICVGFGPASLAIAIALHDTYSKTSLPPPRVLFLEKQPKFGWHSGMQLPGAHMQISFLKDLATPRDPRSKFTFINYLHSKGRLNTFINLSTFLPSRMEYEDYLRWCAGHFEREGCVKYGMDVDSVVPSSTSISESGKISEFDIASLTPSGEKVTFSARHVVIAVGGKPIIPACMKDLPNVNHSSQFATSIDEIERYQRESGKKLRFAVVGSGQSAAEIFNDLWERFGESSGVTVKLIVKGSSLRPSDDSPFVNEIFDPDRVDALYAAPSHLRQSAIALDRATNYGVVRLELLEHLYEKLYMQRIRCEATSSAPRAQIFVHKYVTEASSSDSGLKLKVIDTTGKDAEEEMEVDYVFAATGYRRDAHVRLLEGCEGLAIEGEGTDMKGEEGKVIKGRWSVGRDYRVKLREELVESGSGVWLQGCNEGTHGLSDSLLSILAIRGGELVESMFGEELRR